MMFILSFCYLGGNKKKIPHGKGDANKSVILCIKHVYYTQHICNILVSYICLIYIDKQKLYLSFQVSQTRFGRRLVARPSRSVYSTTGRRFPETRGTTPVKRVLWSQKFVKGKGSTLSCPNVTFTVINCEHDFNHME